MIQKYNTYTDDPEVKLVKVVNGKKVTIKPISVGLYKYEVKIWKEVEKLYIDNWLRCAETQYIITDAKLTKFINSIE